RASNVSFVRLSLPPRYLYVPATTAQRRGRILVVIVRVLYDTLESRGDAMVGKRKAACVVMVILGLAVALALHAKTQLGPSTGPHDDQLAEAAPGDISTTTTALLAGGPLTILELDAAQGADAENASLTDTTPAGSRAPRPRDYTRVPAEPVTGPDSGPEKSAAAGQLDRWQETVLASAEDAAALQEL